MVAAQGSPLTLHAFFFFFSIYGGVFGRLITHNRGLWSAHVYVFTWVRSHLHRSFPVPVCSWHISHPTLSHDLFSPGLSLAEEVPSSASLFYYQCYLAVKQWQRIKRWRKRGCKWLFPAGDHQTKQTDFMLMQEYKYIKKYQSSVSLRVKI